MWTDVKISVEVGGVVSENRTYRDPTIVGLFVPTFGVAVNLNDGLVTAISWDSVDCELCNVSKVKNFNSFLNFFLFEISIYFCLCYFKLIGNDAKRMF